MIYNDTTACKQTEEALRESQELFRQFFDDAPLGKALISLDGVIERVNPALCRMLGYSHEELVKRSYIDITHPDDIPFSKECVSAMLAGERDTCDLQKRYRANDGQIVWAQVVTRILRDSMGDPLRFLATIVDITQRKAADVALLEAENRTSRILESVTDAFLALDRETQITYVNKAGVLMSGMQREELIGQYFWDSFPYARSSNFFSQYEKAVETNKPVHFEEFYPEPLNIWMECHGYPSPEGMSVFIRDVTERKVIEETLRKERAKLAAVVETIDVGIIIADSAGTVLSMNPAALKMHCFEDTSAMFSHREQFFDSFELFSVDGKPMPPEDCPALRSMRGEYFSNLEMRVRDKRTGLQWVGSWSVAPVRNSLNEVILLVLTVQDITERKESEKALRHSEKRFRSLFDHNQDAVFLTIPDGSIKAANLSACKMFGYTEQDICSIGRSGILDANAPRLHAALEERRLKGSVSGYEIIARRKNGEKFPVEVDSVILPGEPVQSFVIMRDISARKLAEESMRQTNETLEQRVAERTELAEARARKLQALAVDLIEIEERERRQFAHLLHDDLQQLLAAAKMQLQSIPNLSNEPQLLYVEQILTESITKARRLSHELSPAVLHHSGLVAGLRWLSGQMNGQFGLNVLLKADTAPAIKNFALNLFVFRAVQELLFNTIKHAGVKQAWVTLTATDHHIVVSVSDQGRGFEPKEFLKDSRKPGFGLLSISERADYIGGSFKIDTAPGQGSCFTLTVPLDTSDPYEMGKKIRSAKQDRLLNMPRVGTSSSGTRVLFVDDHRVMRQGLIKLIIGQPGIHVIGEAENGAEALEQARHFRPDVIIMDISMPEMDGIEATRRIKAELPNVRVIGLTMHDDDQLIGEMRGAGAEVVLRKTISAAEMLKVIYDFQ